MPSLTDSSETIAAPTLRLQAHQRAYAPGEAIELLLLLGNPGEERLTVPLPADNWPARVRLLVQRPDGTPAGDNAVGIAARAHESGARLAIYPGAELAQSFLLNELCDEPTPGWHTARARVDTFDGEWLSNDVRFLVEAPAPLDLALAPAYGQARDQPFEVWSLFRGRDGAALQRRRADWPEPDGTDVVLLDAPQRLLELNGPCTGLVASDLRADVWTAWLCAESVQLSVWQGLQRVGSQPMPFPPGRVLALQRTDDGGAEAIVISAAGDRIAVVQSGPPQSLEALYAERVAATEAAAFSEDNQGEPAGDPEWTAPPLPMATSGPVILLPEPFDACAAARLTGDRVGVVGVRRQDDGVSLMHGVVGPESSTWHRVRLPAARPLSDPCVIARPDGGAVAGMLVCSGPAESPQLLRVCFAFDDQGVPILVRGTGVADLGRLPVPPTRAHLRFALGFEGEPTRLDACVLLEDGAVWAIHGTRPPLRAAASTAGAFEPAVLMCTSRDIAVGVRTPHGRILFQLLDRSSHL